MTNTISLLIVRLLQSDIIENRNYIGKSIMEIVINIEDKSDDELLKLNFEKLLLNCIEDPKSEKRYELHQIGRFYDDLIERSAGKSADAA